MRESLPNLSDVWVLYIRELRMALRERSIVVYSVILPICLYPVIFWLMFTAMVFVEGRSEGFVSRTVLFDLPERHAAIRDSLAAMDEVDLREGPTSRESAIALVRDGELDAVVEFEVADEEGRAIEGNFLVRVTYDRSVERSRRARGRIEGVIGEYRDRWLRREARALGLGTAELEGFRVVRRDIASGRELGSFVLAQMIPIFLIIMVAMGSFYPAIDSTAGERERNTWETLMSVAASRSSIVTAKYFYVATLGTAAGMLNVVAMVVSIGAVLGPLLGSRVGELEFELPALAVPIMLVGAMILALFFAAAMMLVASFARTFKEGQAMITPIYWLALIPIFMLGSPDQGLTAKLALVPIGNMALLVKDAVNGVYQWLLIGEAFLVNLVLVAVCLGAARAVLQFEDYVLGSYDGSFWRLMRERILRRGPKPASAGEV
jgi:sodium transport system permease protein